MRVLVGCEESGTVRNAFKALGHDAWSCDLIPSRDNSPKHLRCDVMEILHIDWDLIILHPDCTAMAVSGNGTYGLNRDGTPKDKHYLRLQAIEWTKKLWLTATLFCDRVALENPNSVIFPHLRKKGANVQYIQPYDFGHGETKKTGFALHGLPELKPTNQVDGREQRIWKMAPGPNRKRDRSQTYQGIAEAMANQWSLTPIT